MEVAIAEWDSIIEDKKSQHMEDEPPKASNLPRHFRFIRALKDDRGRTLAHAAALGSSIDCLRIVLFAGSDPFTPDIDGRTPLHMAVLSTALDDLQHGHGGGIQTRRNSSQSSPKSSASEIVRVLLKVCA